jgi:hypothetical protein
MIGFVAIIYRFFFLDNTVSSPEEGGGYQRWQMGKNMKEGGKKGRKGKEKERKWEVKG